MLAPHTIMCMGVAPFTEENRGSATCGPHISLVDVTCVKSLRSSYMGKYPQTPQRRGSPVGGGLGQPSGTESPGTVGIHRTPSPPRTGKRWGGFQPQSLLAVYDRSVNPRALRVVPEG